MEGAPKPPKSLAGWLILAVIIIVILGIAFVVEAKSPGKVKGLPGVKQIIEAGTKPTTTPNPGAV